VKAELLRERYERLEIAGRGGEAEVIRALDHLHGRQVALKLRPAADDESRGRLLSEARVLLSLTPHPGLALLDPLPSSLPHVGAFALRRHQLFFYR